MIYSPPAQQWVWWQSTRWRPPSQGRPNGCCCLRPKTSWLLNARDRPLGRLWTNWREWKPIAQNSWRSHVTLNRERERKKERKKVLEGNERVARKRDLSKFFTTKYHVIGSVVKAFFYKCIPIRGLKIQLNATWELLIHLLAWFPFRSSPSSLVSDFSDLNCCNSDRILLSLIQDFFLSQFSHVLRKGKKILVSLNFVRIVRLSSILAPRPTKHMTFSTVLISYPDVRAICSLISEPKLIMYVDSCIIYVFIQRF